MDTSSNEYKKCLEQAQLIVSRPDYEQLPSEVKLWCQLVINADPPIQLKFK